MMMIKGLDFPRKKKVVAMKVESSFERLSYIKIISSIKQ